MPISPDDRMTVPIENLLFWSARCVQRVKAWASLPPERFDNPAVREIADKEDEFVRAYRTTLLLRADEVVRACERFGITGCTVAKVRENPFLVAMAIDHILQGGSHEDR
jgi:hypothetical protein